MAVVAVSGILMGTATLAWRARRYLQLADACRQDAAACRAAIAGGYDPNNNANYARSAESFARRERRYRHAALHPWAAGLAED